MKRIAILQSENKWEPDLFASFKRGVLSHGDVIVTECAARLGQADAVAFVGVKRKADFDRYRALGVQTILLDKGYNREKVGGAPKYWRFAVDAHSCTDDIEMSAPGDRAHALGVEMKPWREGENVLYAGSSAKYHAFHDLPEPEEYCRQVFRKLAKLTDRAVYYRPKPSYRDAEPVDRSVWHPWGRLDDALKSAHCMVTHGSNACFEAVCEGVPCIVLGNGVARPISSTQLEDVDNPRLASDSEREAWLNGLSYWQWSRDEMESGECWDYVRRYVN